MTISELYEKLSDKDFLDPTTGNLFSRAYMYLYEPENEYHIRQEIQHFKDRLIRPDTYRNIFLIDIFEEFIEYLEKGKFGQHSRLDFFINQEKEKPDRVEQSLKKDAIDAKFFSQLNDKIETHFNSSDSYEVGYVIIYGFGAIFPYLRASKFLSNFEKYYMDNGKYKLILFYPGSVEDKSRIKLFRKLEDDNPYRAIKLIN